MFAKREIKWSYLADLAWLPILTMTIWSSFVVGLHMLFDDYGYDFALSFQPIELLGITVALYLGFKNNQAYDRFWEGRIIWGGIVNYSRSWANGVLTFLHSSKGESKAVAETARILIRRHIAWLYALSHHLRKQSHGSPEYPPTFHTLSKTRVTGGQWEGVLKPYLSAEEYEELQRYSNIPAQLIRFQGRQLKEVLFEKEWLNPYHHAELTRILEEFYNLQGKCERIKNTPLPRQFANLSRTLVYLFCFLLPFGLVGITSQGLELFLTIPLSVLVGWAFVTAEQVGDLTEDPFENFVYDVPMSALTRTIEIDLCEMVEEPYIPAPLQPENGVLL